MPFVCRRLCWWSRSCLSYKIFSRGNISRLSLDNKYGLCSKIEPSNARRGVSIDGCERKARSRPLTICIAARCIDGSIFCAADRMVTVGDMEMESPTAKLALITNAILIMPSDDDAALHTENLSNVYHETAKRVAADPDIWVHVREIVEIYIAARNEIRSKIAARTFLAPFGLTKETFLDKMATMEPGLVARISEDMV
jgi:hypothetical protein